MGLQVQDDGGVVLYAPGHQVLRVLSQPSSIPEAAYPPYGAPGNDPSVRAAGLCVRAVVAATPGSPPPVKSPSIIKQLEEEAGGTFGDPDWLVGAGCLGSGLASAW